MSDANNKELHHLVDGIKKARKNDHSDDYIKAHLLHQDVAEEDIVAAFDYVAKEDKFNEHVNIIVPHIKELIKKGYSQYYIRRQFMKIGWQQHIIEEAYKRAHGYIHIDRKAMNLEKEILTRLISGEERHHVARTLMKKGWPEDMLKRGFDDLSDGLDKYHNGLFEIDLNHYNKDEIKQVLLDKGWPEDVVNKTLNNIINKVDYHRKLHHIQNEIKTLIYRGKDSKHIEQILINEGYPKDIVDKILFKINLEFVRTHDLDKLKKFNRTELTHKHHHNVNDLMTDFHPIDKDKANLDLPESIRRKKHTLKSLKRKNKRY